MLDLQREIWERTGNQLAVAGLRAEEFLHHPSYDTFVRLFKAAQTAGVWEEVKGPVIDYPDSGGSYEVVVVDRNGRQCIFKDLPATGFVEPGSLKVQRGPFYEILIEKALAERHPEEAVLRYDRSINDKNRPRGSIYPQDKLWDAVAGRFPDRALKYWSTRLILRSRVPR